MTTTHCRALVKPSVVLMAGSRTPPMKQVMNYGKCYISSWGSGSKWLPFLSEAFLRRQMEADTRGTLVVEGENSTFCLNTYCWTDILYRILHTNEYLSPCRVCLLWWGSSAAAQYGRRVFTASVADSDETTVKRKATTNTCRIITFSRCGSGTVIFLIIIFIPAPRPD